MNRRTQFVVLVCIAVIVVGIAVWVSRDAGTLSASRAARIGVGRDVTVEGTVLSSSTRYGRTTLSVADSDGPPVQRIRLEYSGPQRVHFEPGVIVIAHGRIREDGVFEVRDFVLKSPSGWGG
jgi:cytochrome c-type biogenesis protein CcmE